MPLNLTWVDLAFRGTKGYPGQVERHSLPFQEEAVLKYLVVPLTFALDCTYEYACIDLIMNSEQIGKQTWAVLMLPHSLLAHLSAAIFIHLLMLR